MMKLARQFMQWVRRRGADAELREEIESHRAMLQSDLESRGMSAADAAAASRRAMGNMTVAHEDARDVWLVSTIDRLWRDLRYGLRALNHERTFAVIAIAVVAIGVATTTTVFSVVDAELWKPLPFANADRLTAVYVRGPGTRGAIEYISGADFLELAGQNRSFESLAATGDTGRRVLQRATAEPVTASSVTSNYFSTLGLAPVLGRTFLESDVRAGAAVLTERGWQRLFNRNSGVLEGTITLDSRLHRIVGVVPTDALVTIGTDPDLFVVMDPSGSAFQDRAGRVVTSIIGRLRPGIGAALAQSELQTIEARIAQAYPEGRTGRTVHVEDLREFHTLSNARPLYFALGASALVLFLTCANVASLLLIRALRRRREFAIRGALGGGMRVLVWQLAVEASLIAVPAAALALLLTHWSLGALTTQMPADYLRRGSSIPLDGRVSAFAIGVAALTTLVFSLVPVLIARRTDVNLALGNSARTAGAARAQSTSRKLLLVAQIAMTLVLVAAAGLFLKSYVSLTQIPIGFETQNRLALRTTLSGPRYGTDQQKLAYAQTLLDRARALPGVASVALGTTSPLTSGPMVRFTGGVRSNVAPGEEPRAIVRATTPGFFRTLGIPVTHGRDFAEQDTTGAPRVAIVNEFLARQLFPGEQPIGRTLTLLPGARAGWARRPGDVIIVGVVGNVKEVTLDETEFSDIYLPFAQAPAPGFELLVRTSTAPASLADTLRVTAADIDRHIPIGTVVRVERRVDDALREDRFHLLFIGAFAVVGLVLAAIGIYGAVAYAAQQRRREYGVRLALGAAPRRLVLTALRESFVVGLAGGTVGLAATLMVAKLSGNAWYLVPGEHEGLLYGVQTTDPVVLGSAFVALVGVALIAAALPASSLTRLHPMEALRQD